MDTTIIIKSLVFGYFIAGYSSLLRTTTSSPIDTPLMMMKPTLLKKAYWLLAWPIHTYIDVYFMHMPKKSSAIVYGILTIPNIWLGCSILAFAIMYPYIVIDTWFIALIVSMLALIVGVIILMPIITIVCAMLTVALATPIIYLLPKSEID